LQFPHNLLTDAFTFIGKSFQNNENSSSINSVSLQHQQKQLAQDAEELRRAYMENVKQRMRDNQR
jgi:hypothetical protein